MARERSSYAWARHLEASEVPLSQLPPAAAQGYEYARELADDHKHCSEEPPWRRDIPPLTIEEIARERGKSPAGVRGRITRARRALFGDLSDAAIGKRAQRLRSRSQRRCAHRGCQEKLPVAAAANRDYCRHHGSGSERVKRHRHHRKRS